MIQNYLAINIFVILKRTKRLLANTQSLAHTERHMNSLSDLLENNSPLAAVVMVHGQSLVLENSLNEEYSSQQ